MTSTPATSSDASSLAPSKKTRNARVAVSTFFFTNGVLYASMVPHYPGIKADLGLDNSTYGLAIAAYPAGAITLGLLAGWLIRRMSSALVSVVFSCVTAASLILVAMSGSFFLLVPLLFLAGGADALADVGQNAHGLRVQKEYGRSINNSFHAIWSIGAVSGSSLAALLITLDVPRTAHIIGVAVLAATLQFTAYRHRLPGSDTSVDEVELTDAANGATPNTAARRSVSPRTIFILAALVLLGVAGALIEDAGSSWAALYLGGSLGAAAGLATSGYIALVGAQFVGRLLGDPLVDRFGQRTIAYAGGALVLGGMSFALAFPSIPATIVGFGLAGFGSATLIPAAFQGADELPGLKPGTGLTVVSWLLRLGFLLSPPIVGLVADATSLRTGLLVLPLAGLVVLLTAGVLDNRKREDVFARQ